MALSLANLKRVKSSHAPRVLIYGPPKMGKTTLANEFPNAVFLQTEEGENSLDEITTFGLVTDWNDVLSAIGSLAEEQHDFKTIVVDSIDRLEPLAQAYICKKNNWTSIEAPGYGAGYTALDAVWYQFIDSLNYLRLNRGMGAVLIGHSEITRFDDPRSSSYSRFDFRLHKRAHAIIQNEMDLILCLNQEASVQEEKTGFGGKRTHASNSAQRWMYVELLPTMNAGNRYGMPPKIPFVRGQGYAALAQYFPNAQPQT